MKTRQRNIVVALMVLALAGLIAFQIYWINNALQLSRTQFKRNVQESLVQVADRLEEQEAMRLTESSFVFIQHDGKVATTVGNSNVQVKSWSSATTGTNADKQYIFNTDTVYFVGSDDKDEEKKIRNKVEMLDVAVNKIIRRGQWNIKERVSQAEIDSLLRNALNEKGITISYGYGVIEDNTSGKAEVILTGDPSIAPEVLESSYRATLFPNDLEGPDHFLAVYFPQQSGYILEQVGMTLVASIIFIGIILGTFIYTMKVIGRQKKLSMIKTDFINNMTHEFKTPIATISLAAQVLGEKDLENNPEAQRKYVKVIRDENERLAQQVERVLQSSLMENNELRLNKEWESFHVVLLECLETFAAVNTEANISEELRAVNDSVLMDIHHMKNVINNLLDNALKYSDGTCRIEVRSWNADGQFKLAIKDHGMGMDPGQIKYIFDSFYRIPTGNRHDVKGFGLGLSYVQRIVRLHQGEITATSSQGAGSEFIISLPHGE